MPATQVPGYQYKPNPHGWFSSHRILNGKNDTGADIINGTLLIFDTVNVQGASDQYPPVRPLTLATQVPLGFSVNTDPSDYDQAKVDAYQGRGYVPTQRPIGYIIEGELVLMSETNFTVAQRNAVRYRIVAGVAPNNVVGKITATAAAGQTVLLNNVHVLQIEQSEGIWLARLNILGPITITAD